MRDQWSAEDDHRSYRDRRDRPRTERPSSPISSRHLDNAHSGLKIRGRATVEGSHHEASRPRKNSPPSRRATERDRTRSPKRKSKGEGPEHKRDFSEEEFAKRHRRRESRSPPHKHRRESSISPRREGRRPREHRRRSRSPDYATRNRRAADLIPRYRERDDSPRRSPHRDSHFQSRDGTDRLPGDFYIPSSRRRQSPSPDIRDRRRSPLTRRRSRSVDKYSTHRESSPVRHREHRRHSPKLKKRPRSPSPYYGRAAYSREPSPSRKHPSRRFRDRSPVSPRALSRQSIRSRRASRSPDYAPRESRKMQSSTRPIQSILDDNSRPPSPPRPIPSFDSESNGGADSHLREAFPMHGMKASDIHSSHRGGRPQHIDTRHSYASSPQFLTPTSSHHGSPQSGSPFSQGRGGWTGQPQQHFHGQPR